MNPEPQLPADMPGEEAGPGGGPPPPAGDGRSGAGWFRRGRLSFRRWRRSRPFWGGLLLILAGLELLLLPLYSLVIHNAIKVVIYIGIGGVFGIIFGCVLMACGVLSWLHPAQRVFYAIVGVLLALGSFVVTNLGGFFLGMLLGVIGASLVFAWTPVQPAAGGRHRSGTAPPEALAEAPTEPAGTLDDLLGSDEPRQPPGHNRLLALTAVPLLLSGLSAAGPVPAGQAAMAPPDSCSLIIPCLLSPGQSAAAAPALTAPSGSTSPSPAASQPAGPSPSASSSPPASPSPSPTGSAAPPPGATPSPSTTPSPGPAPSPSPTRNPNAGKRASAATALVAASSTAVLTAGTALMTGLSYDGVANVPTASGSQAMLRFSMSSLSLSGGIALTVTGNGQTTVTRNTSIDFTGNVVLYATRLCGDLLGVRLCFSPRDPPPLVLPIMTFTNVATDQPLTTADSADAAGLAITSS